LISLFFALTGFTTIFFNDSMEHHFILFIPAILIVMYGCFVGLSLINNQDKKFEKRRIETINIMGFLYSLMSLGVMLYKLKIFGGMVPDRLALAIALSYLAISITTSLAGLIFHGFMRGIFNRSLPVENVVWLKKRSA